MWTGVNIFNACFPQFLRKSMYPQKCTLESGYSDLARRTRIKCYVKLHGVAWTVGLIVFLPGFTLLGHDPLRDVCKTCVSGAPWPLTTCWLFIVGRRSPNAVVIHNVKGDRIMWIPRKGCEVCACRMPFGQTVMVLEVQKLLSTKQIMVQLPSLYDSILTGQRNPFESFYGISFVCKT